MSVDLPEGNFFLQITNLYFISSNFIRLKPVRDNNFHFRVGKLNVEPLIL